MLLSLPDRPPSNSARAAGEILKRECVLPTPPLPLRSFRDHQAAESKHLDLPVAESFLPGLPGAEIHPSILRTPSPEHFLFLL